MALSLAVKDFCEDIRRHPVAWNAARQLLDCATSMAANYRATSRARSRAEWIAKLGLVVEEADETVFWLEFAQRAGFQSKIDAEALLDEAQQLRAMFAASYATSRRNRGKT